ncbi:unnamed protein product, partial [Symbiodinium pilosum]
MFGSRYSRSVGGQLHYVQVALNMMLKGVEDEPWRRLFDLKGNWLYSHRKAEERDQVWKDFNFRKYFQTGLIVDQVMLPGGQDDGEVYT